MRVFDSPSSLQEHLAAIRGKGSSIGAVLTMGALHAGHVSLIKASVSENEHTVVSIFVNPRQFNDPNDLQNYPRQLDQDIKTISNLGEVVVFAPNAKDVFNGHQDVTVDLRGLDGIMEGRSRPGHFDGVVQVVHRLFEIIQPDKAYFGEKDRQQLMVIDRLVQVFGLPIEIRPCATVRNGEGLALSSRNMLLSESDQKTALILFRALSIARNAAGSKTPAEIQALVITEFEQVDEADLEYFELIDVSTFQRITSWENDGAVAAFIAASVSGVRLIDNMLLKA